MDIDCPLEGESINNGVGDIYTPCVSLYPSHLNFPPLKFRKAESNTDGYDLL